MKNDEHSFGAHARVKIFFDQDIYKLADQLRIALNLTEFTVENDEYPPHELVASAEAMGWEAWLHASGEAGVFILEMATESSGDEVLQGRVHNLSPWLARLIHILCRLETSPWFPDE